MHEPTHTTSVTGPNTSPDHPEQRLRDYVGRHRNTPGRRRREIECAGCVGIGKRGGNGRICPDCKGTGSVTIDPLTAPSFYQGRHRADGPSR